MPSRSPRIQSVTAKHRHRGRAQATLIASYAAKESGHQDCGSSEVVTCCRVTRVVAPKAGPLTGAVQNPLECASETIHSRSHCSNAAISTGFTRCPSQPADCERARSFSCPQPVTAITRTFRAHACARICWVAS